MSEIVVPLVRTAEADAVAADQPAQVAGLPTAEPAELAAVANVRRRFAPGSEWLYLNFYCGTAAADDLLRDMVRPVIEELQQAATIDRWFFIRYGDPDWHLRLRLHGDPARLTAEALPLVERAADAWLTAGRITRWNVDTYDREVERYGGPAGIELAERLFCHDSEATLAIVEQYRGDAGLEARWKLALVGIDRWLDDLGCDLDAKLRVLRPLREGMAQEFHADAGLGVQLGQKFRTERKALESLLAPPADGADDLLATGRAILAERSARMAPALAALAEAESRGLLAGPRESLAGSFVHMWANRVLRSAQRAQEMVLYDFLARLYESQAARRRQPATRALAVA